MNKTNIFGLSKKKKHFADKYSADEFICSCIHCNIFSIGRSSWNSNLMNAVEKRLISLQWNQILLSRSTWWIHLSISRGHGGAPVYQTHGYAAARVQSSTQRTCWWDELQSQQVLWFLCEFSDYMSYTVLLKII